MIKVAILDDYQNISQEFVDLKKLSKKFEIRVFHKPFKSNEEIIRNLKEFEALLIMRERTKFTKEVINKLPKLKYIMTSGMRNKAIDMQAVKQKKIIVCGTELSINSTAELTIAFMLGLSRNFKNELDNMYHGYWQTTIGLELNGKILGLIGLGKVGTIVAKIASAFGMQLMAWSENLDINKCKEFNVLPVTKDHLVENSDYLSIHVQGGKRYENCITLKELKKMKKTSFLINTSRSSIVNEQDLTLALSEKIIAGAGIDVYDIEPLPAKHKLRFIPNALILPHIGYVTVENYSNFYNQMIENLEACFNGEPKRVIN